MYLRDLVKADLSTRVVCRIDCSLQQAKGELCTSLTCFFTSGQFVVDLQLQSVFSMESDDADYLVETVGPVLAKGVAATLAASAPDPVQYLGRWLHKYVENVQIKDEYVSAKAQAAADESAAQEELIAAQKSSQAVEDAKQAAIQEVRMQTHSIDSKWASIGLRT